MKNGKLTKSSVDYLSMMRRNTEALRLVFGA